MERLQFPEEQPRQQGRRALNDVRRLLVFVTQRRAQLAAEGRSTADADELLAKLRELEAVQQLGAG